MKKLFSLFLIITLSCFTMNCVKATDLTQISIAGVNYYLDDVITNSESETVSLPTGLSWDNTTKVITLNNYDGDSIVSTNSEETLKLYLKGTNTITGTKVFANSVNCIGTESGSIIINGDADSVLNLVSNTNVLGKPRNIYISHYDVAQNRVEINAGTINIISTTTSRFANGIYAPIIYVNNNANLYIDITSTNINVERVVGIWSAIEINTSGNVSIVSSHSAVEGSVVKVNSKGNIFFFGKNGFGTYYDYSFKTGADVTSASDYDIRGAANKPAFSARHITNVPGTAITINNIVMDYHLHLNVQKNMLKLINLLEI